MRSWGREVWGPFDRLRDLENGEMGKWENGEMVRVVGRPFDRLRDRIVVLLWSGGPSTGSGTGW